MTRWNGWQVPLRAILLLLSKPPVETPGLSKLSGFRGVLEDLKTGSVFNRSTVTAIDPYGGPTRRIMGEETVPTEAVPALTIDKVVLGQADLDSDNYVDAGDTVIYGFTVTNVGNVAIKKVEKVKIDDPMLDKRGVSVRCRESALAVGATTVCRATLPVTAELVAEGMIVNKASVNGVLVSGGAV